LDNSILNIINYQYSWLLQLQIQVQISSPVQF